MTDRRALFGWLWGEAPRVDEPRRVATVDPGACLNGRADFCATCVERCPVPGAIRLDGRRVVVDDAVCTGCGECAARCPAPGYAILLEPWPGVPA